MAGVRWEADEYGRRLVVPAAKRPPPVQVAPVEVDEVEVVEEECPATAWFVDAGGFVWWFDFPRG